MHSGLLVQDIGGPSVKPYMPPGIWKNISNATYAQDKGSKLYRRSIYTYWRRTIPPPTMMSFNAASRETCIVRMDRTNTPLQALTMMNNITFIEAARLLAENRLIRRQSMAGDLSAKEQDARQIQLAFQLVTSRIPSRSEVELLMADLTAYRNDFKAQPKAAKKLLSVGEHPYNQDCDPIELAAYTLIMNTILNLDEAITQN